MVNIADALSAYRQSTGNANLLGGAASTNEAGGQSFADALKGFANDAVDTIKDGEKAALQGATGKADLASVVTAINNAEMMLQKVVTIRDKVIQAYQSIMQTAV
jgi:flagellar hook-basal body complex protein FliE